jgi:hypothetical protein
LSGKRYELVGKHDSRYTNVFPATRGLAGRRANLAAARPARSGMRPNYLFS